MKLGMRYSCAWMQCACPSHWLSLCWIESITPGHRAIVASGVPQCLTGFPSYPFIDRSEREDKELGELHTNPTSWDSNPGLRIQGYWATGPLYTCLYVKVMRGEEACILQTRAEVWGWLEV